jgi:hypothetical protein
MSTDYATRAKVLFADLFDGRLDRFGVREHVSEDTSSKRRCLIDGRNCVWAYASDDGTLGCITRYGGNAPGKILRAIAEIFETDIFSEYEPQFWGFDTEEEWAAWEKEIAEKHRDEWYLDLCKYLRGEPNEIRPGTNGMTKAQVAKSLVHRSPELMLSTNKDRLLSLVDEIFERDHTVWIKLSAEQVALAEMLATHEDDLPQS